MAHHPDLPSSLKPCNPEEIGLKSFFLGPQAENGPWLSALVLELLEDWFSWRKGLFPGDGRAISPNDQLDEAFVRNRRKFQEAAREIIARYEKEIPKFSPRYVGHMFSEISLPAFLGHLITLFHNPNNVSLESAHVGSLIEDEAINALLELVEMDPNLGFGHFTSGGTIANFEALWRARDRARRNFPDAPISILIPENKHYSWKKGIDLLGLPGSSYVSIGLDQNGMLDIDDLNLKLIKCHESSRPVSMVVSVAGTTELGEIDPIDHVARVLREFEKSHKYRPWHHVDAAYGGFFKALGNSEGRKILGEKKWNSLSAMKYADSITLDPHKLGYVPYACGAFLCASKDLYRVREPDAPYVQFSGSLDRGKHTIEGSRSATGATAIWLTQKSIGFVSRGEDQISGFGKILAMTIHSKFAIERALKEWSERRSDKIGVWVARGCDTNILCFHLTKAGMALAKSNALTEAVARSMSIDQDRPIFVSQTKIPIGVYKKMFNHYQQEWAPEVDADHMRLVRVCVMNPFFMSKEMTISFLAEFTNSLERAIEMGGLP